MYSNLWKPCLIRSIFTITPRSTTRCPSSILTNSLMHCFHFSNWYIIWHHMSRIHTSFHNISFFCLNCINFSHLYCFRTNSSDCDISWHHCFITNLHRYQCLNCFSNSSHYLNSSISLFNNWNCFCMFSNHINTRWIACNCINIHTFLFYRVYYHTWVYNFVNWSTCGPNLIITSRKTGVICMVWTLMTFFLLIWIFWMTFWSCWTVAMWITENHWWLKDLCLVYTLRYPMRSFLEKIEVDVLRKDRCCEEGKDDE